VGSACATLDGLAQIAQSLNAREIAAVMEVATTRTADVSAIRDGEAERAPHEYVQEIVPLTVYAFKVYASAMRDLAAIIVQFLHALADVLAMVSATKQDKNVIAPRGSPETTVQHLYAHLHVLDTGTV